MTLWSRLKEIAAVANVGKPVVARPLTSKPLDVSEMPVSVTQAPTIKAANEAINALPPVTHPNVLSFVNLRAPALTLADKIAAAERLGVTIKHINMLLKVESGGKSFDDKGRPIILYEPHIFHRRTGGKWSPSNFSYAKWGMRPYPGSFDGRWAQMAEAAKHNRSAALESASWGLFQVMGFHWKALGYASADVFAEAMTSGEPAQLDAMVRFITVNGLKGALQACRAGDPDSCRAFAKGYNGAGYAANDYHTKLARALR